VRCRFAYRWQGKPKVNRKSTEIPRQPKAAGSKIGHWAARTVALTKMRRFWVRRVAPFCVVAYRATIWVAGKFFKKRLPNQDWGIDMADFSPWSFTRETGTEC
jgi:hypothetical protein